MLLAMIGVLAGRSAAAQPMEALVPAYFYPNHGGGYGDDWYRLAQAAGTIGVNAILNPNSGPGARIDENYVTAVNSLRAAGGRVFAYVHTSYGNRSATTVRNEIDKYIGFYAIDGVFLDEMSTSASDLNYYSGLYGYIKSQSGAYRVIGNPGTNTLESYLTTPTADALTIFEDRSDLYSDFTSAAWVVNHGAEHFAHILHTAPEGNLGTFLTLAASRNASLVYVTDDVLSNPYDALPSYWDEEVAAIAALSVPEPSTQALAGIGLLLVLAIRYVRR
jgi:hypothetical protein